MPRSSKILVPCLAMFATDFSQQRGDWTWALVFHAVGPTVQCRTPPDSQDTVLKNTLYLVPSEKQPGTPIQVMQLWGWVELARFLVEVFSRLCCADLQDTPPQPLCTARAS